MTIRFECNHCGKKLKAPDAGAGRKTLCTGCGQKVVIPGVELDDEDEAPVQEVAHSPLSDEGALDPFHLMPRRNVHFEDLIDMTAMVDIVFFMLIFFMVASAQAIVAVMPMPPVQAQSGAAGKVKTVAEYQEDPEFLTIRIEDDDSVWIDEVAAFGEVDVRAKIRAERAKDAERRGVLVMGNADASHGQAVLVFDACMDAGFDDIRLTIQESKDET